MQNRAQRWLQAGIRRATQHRRPAQVRLEGQRVWIVGASSGIGAALASELSRRGARVGLTARSRDGLERTAHRCPGQVSVAPADVTQAQELTAAVEQVRAELGGIDVVVYSTGFWEPTEVEAWSAGHFAQHVDVNLKGLGLTLELVLPAMIAQRRGHVVGLASVAGIRGLAGGEAYGATKAAQIHLLEGLRVSLRRYGVVVTTVCPGFVRTPMTSGNTFPMPMMVEPEEAAVAIADGMERQAAVVTFPLTYRLGFLLAKGVPSAWWARLVAPRQP